jgi:hypothetical protein
VNAWILMQRSQLRWQQQQQQQQPTSLHRQGGSSSCANPAKFFNTAWVCRSIRSAWLLFKLNRDSIDQHNGLFDKMPPKGQQVYSATSR